ncbi:MAG: ABC transporter substrate-binding protein [Granulosicoccus sp.]|nr:ABC transporter substrate-binding protein [Granulosicoccus sp.]
MRQLVFLTLFFFSIPAWAMEWEEQQLFRGTKGTDNIRVISSTDTAVFSPLIEQFLSQNPDINIEYFVASSGDLFKEVLESPDEYDVVISSAMDLQLKLVNDGFARQVSDVSYPDWAHWRKSLFGFTLEPASIVINKAAFSDLMVPETRQALLELLRSHPERFLGQIGTYDIRDSGLGYLFATQDARGSETYWRLTEIMGGLKTRLYCCSNGMIEDLANNQLAIAYNVLGSYAETRSDLTDKLSIIHPDDFPNIMMRTVLITSNTKQIRATEAFLRYLISAQWASTSDYRVTLSPIPLNDETLQRSVIPLEPGLMIFLDTQKRRQFIKDWENAIIQ